MDELLSIFKETVEWYQTSDPRAPGTEAADRTRKLADAIEAVLGPERIYGFLCDLALAKDVNTGYDW